MAILKHFNVKNKDYSATVRYCVFQHDDHARPLRDNQGHYILRENYLIDGINCCPLSYDIECRSSNRQWEKNLNENDIRQHHFIISFEPSDIEYGLTVEKAQELGMEFAQNYFAGHQCIVATHADGNNHSQNIHCHISINSLRIHNLPKLPSYTNFERDRLAGYKFHPTDKCMRYLKEQLMELCRSNGLGQVELNKPAKKRVTDQEYWAEKRGQEHTPSEPTKFQTELGKIRTAIDEVKVRADSVEDFKAILLKEYGISIRDKRGQWSYKPADRKQGVTARRLGDAYTMESVTAFITKKHQCGVKKKLNIKEQNQQHIPAIPVIPEEPLVLFAAKKIFNLQDPKYKNNIGLEQWAKLQNLKEMSRRFNFICESGIHVEALVQRAKKYQSELSAKTDKKEEKEQKLKDINNLLQWEGQLNQTKVVYQQCRDIADKKQQDIFYQNHQEEIDLHRSAQRKINKYKKTHGYADKKLPSMKQLSVTKTDLLTEIQTISEEIALLKSDVNLLTAAQKDVMAACESLDLLTGSEYYETFGKKKSIRKHLNRKKSQPEQENQKKHRKSHDYQDLE